MFIVIEGADGTGKSTLAAALAQHLNATLTAEPSRALIGQWVRANLNALPAVALPLLFAVGAMIGLGQINSQQFPY